MNKVDVVVYLDGNNVSAISGLHVVCADACKLPCLIQFPGLMERTEGAVDCRDTRRWRAQGCVHHHVLYNNKHAQRKRLAEEYFSMACTILYVHASGRYLTFSVTSLL